MSYHNQPISSCSDLNAHRSKDRKGRITSSQQSLSVRDRALVWTDTTLKRLNLKAGSLICRIIRKMERIRTLSTEAERKLDRHTSRTESDRCHQHDRTSHSLRRSAGRCRRRGPHDDTPSTEGRRESHHFGETPRVPNQYSRDPSTRQSQSHTRAAGDSASRRNLSCSTNLTQKLEPSRFRPRVYVEDASTLLPPSLAVSKISNRQRAVANDPNLTMSRGRGHILGRPEGTSNPRPPIAYDSTVSPLIRKSLAAHGLIKVGAPTVKQKTVQFADERSWSRTIGEKRKTVQTPVPYSSLMWPRRRPAGA